MLLDFTVENALSFREPQQFSMRRTVRVPEGEAWPQPQISTLAAIYGGNASGKTNFLRCLRFFSNFVATSFRAGDATSGTSATPFLLDDDSENHPSTFFAEFIAADGSRYQYWFSLTQDRIVEEVLWLFRAETNRKTVLFEREDGKPVHFGAALRSGGRLVERITRPNALLLSTAAASGIAAVQPAFDEIAKTIQSRDTVDFSRYFATVAHYMRRNPVIAEQVAELLKFADFGITGVDFRAPVLPGDPVFPDDPGQIATALASLHNDSRDSSSFAAAGDQAQSGRPQMLFTHAGRGVTRQFSPERESEGTRNAMLLFLWIIESLTKPTVLLIDEIDTSLSPALRAEILGLYRDPATNPHQSQLIFTTHDLSLISASGADRRVLDRDQIWFITKSGEGESSLHPLTEWEERDVNFGKNYQHGVYAATPQPTLHETVARIFQAPTQAG